MQYLSYAQISTGASDRTGHVTNDSDQSKLSCFYCKSLYNMALCPRKYKEATQTLKWNKEKLKSTTITNSIIEKNCNKVSESYFYAKKSM